MSNVIIEMQATEHLNKRAKEHPKILKRIVELMNSIRQDPFSGIGKPEALKHQYSGCWSRRITDEQRIVYKVDSDKNVTIYSIVNHYPQD